MKRGLAIVGLVVLAAALIFLNQGMKKSVVPDQDEDQAAAQSQKAAVQTPPMDPSTVLPPEETIGDPKTAQHHIQLGWVYADNYYSHPESMTVPIQAIRDYVRNSQGHVSAEIVDLDVPPADRSPNARTVAYLGLQVDGQILYDHNPSDVPSNVEGITNELDGVLGKG